MQKGDTFKLSVGNIVWVLRATRDFDIYKMFESDQWMPACVSDSSRALRFGEKLIGSGMAEEVYVLNFSIVDGRLVR